MLLVNLAIHSGPGAGSSQCSPAMARLARRPNGVMDPAVALPNGFIRCSVLMTPPIRMRCTLDIKPEWKRQIHWTKVSIDTFVSVDAIVSRKMAPRARIDQQPALGSTICTPFDLQRWSALLGCSERSNRCAADADGPKRHGGKWVAVFSLKFLGTTQRQRVRTHYLVNTIRG